jgi:hypothetical protein
MKALNSDTPDIEVCRRKIISLLAEYNCTITDPDEGSWALIQDRDTGEVGNLYHEILKTL